MYNSESLKNKQKKKPKKQKTKLCEVQLHQKIQASMFQEVEEEKEEATAGIEEILQNTVVFVGSFFFFFFTQLPNFFSPIQVIG